jgi:hypothetical protein
MLQLMLVFSMLFASLSAATAGKNPSTSDIGSDLVLSRSSLSSSSDLDGTFHPSTSKVKSKNPKAKAFTYKDPARARNVEKRRREKVDSFKAEFEHLRATILSKDPLTFTRKEQLEIADFRLRLQIQLDNYKRSIQVPYVRALHSEIVQMKSQLTGQKDYIDREKYPDEQKRKNKEAQARFKTRVKVIKHDIYINPPSRTLKSSLEKAPFRIQRKREIKNKSRQRRKERLQREQARERRDENSAKAAHQPEDLLGNGWGNKRRRTM